MSHSIQQSIVHPTATRDPTPTLETRPPTSVTTPTSSCPGTIGYIAPGGGIGYIGDLRFRLIDEYFKSRYSFCTTLYIIPFALISKLNNRNCEIRAEQTILRERYSRSTSHYSFIGINSPPKSLQTKCTSLWHIPQYFMSNLTSLSPTLGRLMVNFEKFSPMLATPKACSSYSLS